MAAPVLVSDVADAQLPAGSPTTAPATFAVSATGQGTLAYQWFRLEVSYKNNKFIGSYERKLPAETGTSLTVTDWAGFGTFSSSTRYSYYVTVTDETGAVTSRTARASIMVVVPPLAPNLFQDLQPLYAAKEGETLTLSAGVTANPLIVSWFHDDRLVPGLTNTFFSFNPATLADRGRWWLVVSNALGSVTSRVAQVDIAPVVVVPDIEFSQVQFSSQTVDLDHLVTTNWPSPTAADFAGQSLTLAITGGQPPFVTTGTWGVSLAADGTYSVAVGVMPAATGQWTHRQEAAGVTELALTGFYADQTTATLSLLANRYFELSKVGVVANQHGNWSLGGLLPTLTTNLPRAEFSLVASTTGGLGLSYQWFKDGEKLTGITGTTLLIDPVTPADAGSYTCVVTRSDGKTRSSPAGILTVLGGAVGEVAITVSDGSLILTWPPGASLQSRSELGSADWQTVDAVSPATVSPTNAAGFFRWITP
jgi:hypothetical protein